jgi:hypothetical protein
MCFLLFHVHPSGGGLPLWGIVRARDKQGQHERGVKVVATPIEVAALWPRQPKVFAASGLSVKINPTKPARFS